MNKPTLAISRRTRRTPFSPRVEQNGVQSYTVYNHMLLPTSFRGVEEDYHHLKTHVQLWDVGAERQVEIKGRDSFRLVQLMTVRDLSGISIGRCFYVPLVDANGGIVNDPLILKIEENRYWISIADSDVLLWAKGLAYGMELDVDILEPDVWPLAIQGPKSDALMIDAFGEVIKDIRFFGFQSLPFKGHEFIVARSGWSKQGGFEIYVDRVDLALELWDFLWDIGKVYDVGIGCPNLIERIEGGLLSYGNDMTADISPLECGFDRYCDLDTSFESIGLMAVKNLKKRGISRRIMGLRISGDPLQPNINIWKVFDESQSLIGYVTSAAWSPTYDATLAIAMIDKKCWSPEQVVQVDTPEGIRNGIVQTLPFPKL